MNLHISWQGLKEYFFSISGNGLLELTVFISIVLLCFYGRHIFVNFGIRRFRKTIPLSIGGWGTRGKSGTERLKAAIFNALGYSVISKTTGCEAMFIYTPACGEPKEMFLFRPYDKATIWEQANLLKVSSQLRAEVFLWECMALTPSYVKVLQQDWMKDDLATITNTFPDHEDIQGPAGYNIPEVMTEFISPKSHVVTTEESMLPILQEDVKNKRGKLEAVGWLEAGLISEELLERFPYEEHPYNIALVAAMAKELGMEEDRAIKEMADRVVADLGVLKTYPASKINERTLEFVMGMSANERFGCLGNWTRMKFDQPENSPEHGVWVTTVVNNRADRIARSEVFSRILVHDVQADRHVLIGKNLVGLMGYIESEREIYLDKLFGQEENKTGEKLLEILNQESALLRMPQNIETLDQRLKVCSQGLKINLDSLNPMELKMNLEEKFKHTDGLEQEKYKWSIHFLETYIELEKFRAEYQNDLKKSYSIQPLSKFLDRVFFDKIVVVEDALATGDEINKVLAEATPPGFYNKCMGMQNIKGTGLDFVYRWQAWELIYRWGQDLLGDDVTKAYVAIDQLLSFQEYGVLDREYLPEVIEKALRLSHTQNESFQAMLYRLKSKHEAYEEILEKSTPDPVDESFIKKWFNAVVSKFEPLLDSGDAVRRRKQADQIYDDLIFERISMDKASLELKKLTKRQKGGWLVYKGD